MNLTHNPPGWVGPPPLLTRLDSLTSLTLARYFKKCSLNRWLWSHCLNSSSHWMVSILSQILLIILIPSKKKPACCLSLAVSIRPGLSSSKTERSSMSTLQSLAAEQCLGYSLRSMVKRRGVRVQEIASLEYQLKSRIICYSYSRFSTY